MLDEPFANVDPNTVTEIQKVISELSAEGIAILITDHQIDATMEIAQYCYVIYDGQVLCNGDPVSVLSHPEARKLYFGEKSQQQLENLMKKIRQLKPVDGALRQHCLECDATNDLKPREHGSALLTCASCGSNHVEYLSAQGYATWLADHRDIQE